MSDQNSESNVSEVIIKIRPVPKPMDLSGLKEGEPVTGFWNYSDGPFPGWSYSSYHGDGSSLPYPEKPWCCWGTGVAKNLYATKLDAAEVWRNDLIVKFLKDLAKIDTLIEAERQSQEGTK